LLADGHRYDIVEAVLATQGHDPAGAAAGVAALQRWAEDDDWAATLQSFARCVRITRSQASSSDPNTAVPNEPAEKELAGALQKAEAQPRRPGSVDDFLNAFRPMVPAISRFFEEVLVMAQDPAVRASRLALLQRIVALADGVADLSKLEGF
jgi:glycyl-tRNA synthetase beta subunit